MRRSLAFLLSAGLIAGADDKWISLKSEAFELYTNADDKPGRQTLALLEQFRHALGKIIGKPDMRPALPTQVLLVKPPLNLGPPIQPGRDKLSIVLPAGAAPSPEFLRDFARLLLDANTDRMPAPMERGIVELFSTAEISRIQITLGKPSGRPDLDWARIHLLVAHPDYYGRLSVLLFNLQKGVDEEPAYRNAFGKTHAQIEQEAKQHLAAGKFETVAISSKPMSPDRDFIEKPVEREAAQQILAGLARERELLAEYAGLLRTGTKESLRKAAEIQPKRAEPHLKLAALEPDPKLRIAPLKIAVSLDRRNAQGWRALAEAYVADHQYGEAMKAWRSAEQASTTDTERAGMRAGRLAVEAQRLDWEEAERRRIAAENEREIRKLKDAEIARLRELEARVNQGQKQADPGEKVVEWWDGPVPQGKVTGTLKQIDCLGKQARLNIEAEDRKLVRLMVRDPGKIAIVGSVEASLGCGKQSRKVTVEYFPKPDAKLTTAGDVATIEFR